MRSGVRRPCPHVQPAPPHHLDGLLVSLPHPPPHSLHFFVWDLIVCAPGLADTDVPRGQLDKDEFFLACKLVALAQAGKPLDSGPASLATKVPLPKLGQFGADSSA